MYQSVDLGAVRYALCELFLHVRNIEALDSHSMVQTVFIGDSKDEEVKLDLCYDDPRIDALIKKNELRLASVKEIGAMKMKAMVNGERRKDYWDTHKLMETYHLEEIIGWAVQKYPYTLTREEILMKICNVWDLDDKTEVISLENTQWEFIADDLYEDAKLLIEKTVL